MNKHFEEARQVLIELDSTIARKKEVRERLCTRLPFGEQCSEDQWNQLNARCWIYGTPHPEEYLEQRIAVPAIPSKVSYAELDASSVIAQWSEFIGENGNYSEFSHLKLPEAVNNERLWQYLSRLEEMRADGDFTDKPQRRAFHCFLHYLRQENIDEQVAFLEQILPAKHDVHDGAIRRIISYQERPLSIEAAGTILKNLSQKSIQGRANARRNCAEALALCWMCLAVGRLRLPVRLADLQATMLSALRQIDGVPNLYLPTLFGWQQIKLPEHSNRFLIAMCEQSRSEGAKTMLRGHFPVLRRSLEGAVREADPEGKLGKITFSTFLAPPHYAGQWRR